mmetsp:Transcript_61536/g.164784  ORF Transcript_61536/g.164784 Transcript_61536/m.164784 type:complete len:212 (+) Transcript_61536:240-875(+)
MVRHPQLPVIHPPVRRDVRVHLPHHLPQALRRRVQARRHERPHRHHQVIGVQPAKTPHRGVDGADGPHGQGHLRLAHDDDLVPDQLHVLPPLPHEEPPAGPELEVHLQGAGAPPGEVHQPGAGDGGGEEEAGDGELAAQGVGGNHWRLHAQDPLPLLKVQGPYPPRPVPQQLVVVGQQLRPDQSLSSHRIPRLLNRRRKSLEHLHERVHAR